MFFTLIIIYGTTTQFDRKNVQAFFQIKIIFGIAQLYFKVIEGNGNIIQVTNSKNLKHSKFFKLT